MGGYLQDVEKVVDDVVDDAKEELKKQAKETAKNTMVRGVDGVITTKSSTVSSNNSVLVGV